MRVSSDIQNENSLAWVSRLVRMLEIEQDAAVFDCFNCIVEADTTSKLQLSILIRIEPKLHAQGYTVVCAMSMQFSVVDFSVSLVRQGSVFGRRPLFFKSCRGPPDKKGRPGGRPFCTFGPSRTWLPVAHVVCAPSSPPPRASAALLAAHPPFGRRALRFKSCRGPPDKKADQRLKAPLGFYGPSRT